MTDFEVGQRVRVVATGAVGIVKSKMYPALRRGRVVGSKRYTVLIDGRGRTDSYRDEDLERVEQPPGP